MLKFSLFSRVTAFEFCGLITRKEKIELSVCCLEVTGFNFFPDSELSLVFRCVCIWRVKESDDRRLLSTMGGEIVLLSSL